MTSRRNAGEQRELVKLRTLPSEWVRRYRHIAGENGRPAHAMDFRGREWQRDILDDLHPRVVIMKAAQMGLTELAMSRAIHAVDMLGVATLYVFPTKDDASDFSAGRFDPMLAISPHLAEIFTDVDNVGLKRAGVTPLYMRGCTRRQLKSVPVGSLLLDEVDEMSEEMVELARQRIIGHASPTEWNLSTPHYPGTGIHTEYLNSDARRWCVPCPHCGHRQALEWELNVHVADTDTKASWFHCSEDGCGDPWSEEQRVEAIDAGAWVVSNPGAPDHGYHISQLYSPVTSAERLAKDWREAQRSATRLTEFYNSKLGLPFEPQGITLTRGVVRDCCGMAQMVSAGKSSRARALGVDVGLRAHWVITELVDRRPVVVRVGTVGALEELDFVVTRFGVQAVVCDALPERHKAMELRGRMERAGVECLVAFYPSTDVLGGEEVVPDYTKGIINIHRTGLADRLAAWLSDGGITLPGDIPDEFVDHCSNVYRATVEPRSGEGQPRAVWKHRGPDHYFHAALYSTVALDWFRDDVEDEGAAGDQGDPVWQDVKTLGDSAPFPIDGLAGF